MAQDGSSQMVRILITHGGLLHVSNTRQQPMESRLRGLLIWFDCNACLHRLHIGVTVKSST